jgi:hypothetical protein
VDHSTGLCHVQVQLLVLQLIVTCSLHVRARHGVVMERRSSIHCMSPWLPLTMNRFITDNPWDGAVGCLVALLYTLSLTSSFVSPPLSSCASASSSPFCTTTKRAILITTDDIGGYCSAHVQSSSVTPSAHQRAVQQRECKNQGTLFRILLTSLAWRWRSPA